MAFSPQELARDQPLAGVVEAILALQRDWDVSFLSARGWPEGFEATVQWLREYGFQYSRLILVAEPLEKIDWLEDAGTTGLGHNRRCSRSMPLLIDDLQRGHHLASPELDEEMVRRLHSRGVTFKVFSPDATPWPQLALRLAEFAIAADQRPTTCAVS